jgi:ABC-2 type transport system ATP-binding protein
MPDTVIEATGLRRSFGDLAAVDGIDLGVERGQFYGFLGPNGAGKSTTIKMLTGMLRPTSGAIRILGFDLQQDPVEVKRRIGVVPEGLALFERLTGTQLLNFVGRMYGLSRETAAERGAELLEFMELTAASKQMVTDYSHGMKKKIALAAAVIHRPEILFLDEPFEGVDAVASSTLKGLLQRFLARGGTVFLTSHVLEVVERLCTHIGIIQRGRMVVSASLDDLRAGVEVPQAGAGALTLEQIFLQVVGGTRSHEGELSWF